MATMQRDSELTEIFRAELSEMLDSMAAILERMETANAEERSRDVQAAFRIMHTMKGSAAVVGETAISTLAHAIEDVLDHLRQLAAAPSNEDISMIAETLPILEGLAAGTLEESAITPYIERLRSTNHHALLAAEKASEVEDLPPPTRSTKDLEITADSHMTDAFVRVDVQRLDRLVARVGELLPLQARFGAYVDEFEELIQSLGIESNGLPSEFQRRASALLRRYALEVRKFGRAADDLVDTTKRVRMLPLSMQTSHWNRLVHEAARTLGKHVDLTVHVGDVEVDKPVFDVLRDPLFHILRNAVDHGIESPAVRQSKGKPDHGCLLISARITGTMIDVDVSDDGAGIDMNAIREHALRAGFITPEEAALLTPEQAASLMFRPGLSTAKSVSTISGRGVGLDAVRQAVRSVGGTIDVIPPILGGTSFRIRVPMTIALLRGLLVRCDNQRMVLPVEHVVHVRRARVDTIRRVGTMFILESGLGAKGAEGDPKPQMSNSDNEPLRLHWSGAANRIGKQRAAEAITIVVVSHADMRVGFVVEAILGEQQFIARPLPWNLQHVPGVSGVVFLPDGTVATVLDVARLFDNDHAISRPIVPTKTGSPSRIVVADDSIAIRTMMRNALEGAGYQVFLCADGHEAWETLTSREAELLVSDIRMPRIDGLELTRRVRADARLAHLPVVLVTSLDRKEDLVAGAAAGANEYIIKSQLDQTKLLEAVARLV